MFVDHLIQHRISSWPKTAEKRGFSTCVTDRRTDGRTDRPTDRPSYRDAFLTDASKNHPNRSIFTSFMVTLSFLAQLSKKTGDNCSNNFKIALKPVKVIRLS